MSRLLGLEGRVSLLAAALVAGSCIVVGYWTYAAGHRELIEREERQLVDDAALVALALSARIDVLRSDVLYLAGTSPTLAVTRSGVAPPDDAALIEWSSRLEIPFAQMLRTRPDYTQVRLIGLADGGRELVRVDRSVQGVRSVREDALQRKGSRSYVNQAARQDVGEVHLSDFELNRERGEISYPRQPVIRAGTPVPGEDGRIFGIIVINLHLDGVFETVVQSRSSQRVYLLNERGDFLVHPDVSKTFRFELGEPYRVGQEFPSLAAAFGMQAERATGVTELGGAEWTLGMSRRPFDPSEPDRHVTTIVAAPREQVLAASTAARDHALAAGSLLILLSASIGFVLARRITRQIGGEPAEIEAITRRVADGDLDIEFAPAQRRGSGIFGSVRRMVVSLREARAASERSHWLESELSEGLEATQRAQTLEELARTAVAQLARATDSVQGAFYLRDSVDRDELRRIGAFACDVRDGEGSLARIGEGLIGQCALERRVILCEDFPPDYVRIHSGLGSGTPINLIFVPVHLHEEILAVLELASFKRYHDHHRNLLERMRVSLAVAIQARLSAERTESLLRQTQALSERAQAQAEKLRVANEELAEKGHELAQQTEELGNQAEELRVANEELSEKGLVMERQTGELRTSNERLEELRRALEEKARDLERSSAYKSEFLANMSHELRTPLNSMLLLARNLLDNKSGNLTEEQLEEVSVIERGGQELLRLINGILDLARIEAGKVDIHVEILAIDALVQGLRGQFEPLAVERGLRFEIEQAADLPGTIESDEQRLAQVLRNLLANAIKFTPEGYVRLRIRRATAGEARGAEPGPERIAFEVSDSGIGIPEDLHEAIFESFTQVDGSKSRRYGGSGLGLAISRQLAELLEGEIRLESSRGAGSTFTLLLPARPEERPQVTADSTTRETRSNGERSAPPAADAETGRVVLIVEDDPDFARTLARIVGDRGYESHIATSGAAALRSAADLRPCAVLLDLGLPDIDGTEVLDRLTRDPRTARIPVHVLTAREDAAALLQNGAVEVLTKPVKAEVLEAVFDRLGRTRNILVVDPDAATRQALERLLASDQVRVFTSDGAGDVADSLAERAYDCLVIDHSLCDAKVRDRLRALVEDSAGGRPAVIVETAPQISEDEERSLRAFASALVVKEESARTRLLDEVALFLHSVERVLPPEQRQRVSMLPDAGPSLAGKRVLVVDDDVRNTFALAKMLRSQGLEVVLADDGRLALERLADSGPIDAVLMDMMMPVMDGYEAIQEIRRMPRFAELPILAITARAMAGDRQECLDAGASEYLTKPLDPDRLLAILRIWLVERV